LLIVSTRKIQSCNVAHSNLWKCFFGFSKDLFAILKVKRTSEDSPIRRIEGGLEPFKALISEARSMYFRDFKRCLIALLDFQPPTPTKKVLFQRVGCTMHQFWQFSYCFQHDFLHFLHEIWYINLHRNEHFYVTWLFDRVLGAKPFGGLSS